MMAQQQDRVEEEDEFHAFEEDPSLFKSSTSLSKVRDGAACLGVLFAKGASCAVMQLHTVSVQASLRGVEASSHDRNS